MHHPDASFCPVCPSSLLTAMSKVHRTVRHGAIGSAAAPRVLAGLLLLVSAGSAAGQDLHCQDELAAAATACAQFRPPQRAIEPQREPRARHAQAILIGTSAALATYGWRNWWRDGFRSRFRTTSEGWFGRDTYSGGADKLGHFYMPYASSRLLTRLLVWNGAAHANALQTAGWYTLGAYAAIEVLDGFSRNWRFSHEDMVMNVAGVGAGAVLELYPALDRKFDVRVLYRPSREEGRRFDPFGDYSGQTYLFVTKLAGFDGLPRTSWLRYVELTAGYGSRGFAPAHQRSGTRKLYVGVSFNLSELLARPQNGERPAAIVARTVLEYVQLPGTAVMAHRALPPRQAAADEQAARSASAPP